MDYCAGDADTSTWHCARAITLGIVSVITWLLCLVALHRTINGHIRTQSHSLNVIMLTLSTLQSNLDWVERLGKRESRLQLLSIVLRMLETVAASAAYAQTESLLASKSLIRTLVLPFNALVLLATLGLFIASCVESDVSCEHPYWLSISALQLSVSLIFVLIGCRASRDVSQVIASTALSGNLIRKRRDLWLLMAVFGAASLAQVGGDAWRMDLYKRGRSCEVHETHLEEALRTALSIVSFDVPVWAILFVFYYRQRRDLDPMLVRVETPSIQLLSSEEQGILGRDSRVHPDDIVLDMSGVISSSSEEEEEDIEDDAFLKGQQGGAYISAT